ncbi:hypothetical protein [Frigoribacterium faeni]|nr:hypothetical protein [Frigoribacterium faeni]
MQSIAGEPITVLDWFFVPGRATVVVLSLIHISEPTRRQEKKKK